MILDSTNGYMQFIFILALAFAGALSKDYYDMITHSDEDIKIGRVLLGTTTGALIGYIIAEQTGIIGSSERLFVFLCYLLGIGGFKTFEWILGVNVVELLLIVFRIDADSIKRIREDENEENENNEDGSWLKIDRRSVGKNDA